MKKTKSTALDEYFSRTQSLFTNCEQWIAELGLKVAHGEVKINEERHGQYEAPTLKMVDTEGKPIAEVIPFGQAILGACGRVDIVGEYGKREKIVYLSTSGPIAVTGIQVGEGGFVEQSTRPMLRGVNEEGWYWISPSPIRRAYPLTQEVFRDLLSAVSGHEF